MSLKIRRGTNAERLTITPVEGELIYTTDTKNLYIGDGIIAGGKFITGPGYTGSAGTGYAGSAGAGYTGSAGTTGYVGSTGTSGYTGSKGNDGSFSGTLTSQLNTSSYNITNGSNLIINGTSGEITSPSLKSVRGLSFDTAQAATINGNSITIIGSSISFVNVSHTDLTTPWTSFVNFNNTQNTLLLALTRGRGSAISPLTVTSGDELGGFSAAGFNGTDYIQAGTISMKVDGSLTSGKISGKWYITASNSSGTLIDTMKINSNQVEMVVPPVVPVYTDDTARDAAITSATKGMIIVVGTSFYGYNGTSWVQLNN